MIKAFLDANVYFAGCYSKKGASHFILGMAERSKILLFSSRLVLLEAERNLRLKSTPPILRDFRRFLKKTKIEVMPPLDEKILARYESHIHPKDVPVLAAAVESKSDYLVTLDRRHFFNPSLSEHFSEIKILTPGDFLQRLTQNFP